MERGCVRTAQLRPSPPTETQSFVLNFYGRVTLASVKNFQIIHPNDRAPRRAAAPAHALQRTM